MSETYTFHKFKQLVAGGPHGLIGDHTANIPSYDLLHCGIGVARRNYFKAQLLQKMRKQPAISGIVVNQQNEFGESSH